MTRPVQPLLSLVLLVIAVVISATVGPVLGGGGGRAFPRRTQTSTEALFQQINPDLKWDPTNHLTDLAGNEVDCDVTSATISLLDKTTQFGESVSAVVDRGEGTASDVDSVAGYLSTILGAWLDQDDVINQIKGATKFGCSVLPGCQGGSLSVACLFSPGSKKPESILEPPDQSDQPQHEESLTAQAFTDEQYAVAEDILGSQWDRSHYLENLSGLETNCAMVGNSDWRWKHPLRFPELQLTGQFGSAENTGFTEPALTEILSRFKHYPQAKGMGCSLIPDCIHKGRMYVVASCLYED